MQTDPAAEQSKIIRCSESLWNLSGRKGKDLWRKGFAEEPEWNTERVREDAGGYSEDGEELHFISKISAVLR